MAASAACAAPPGAPAGTAPRPDRTGHLDAAKPRRRRARRPGPTRDRTCPRARSPVRPTPANVTAGNDVLFPITAALGPFPPSDRAAALTHKLQLFIADPQLSPEDIKAVENENGTDILAGEDDVLTRVTDQDADFDNIGRTRQALAADHVAKLRAAVVKTSR